VCRKCLQCGSEKYLISLEDGALACMDCLNKLGKEQLEITNRILDILNEYESLNKLENKIKCLKAIALYLELAKDDLDGN